MACFAALLQDRSDVAGVGNFSLRSIRSLGRQDAADRFGLAKRRFSPNSNGSNRVGEKSLFNVRSPSPNRLVSVVNRAAVRQFSGSVQNERFGNVRRLQRQTQQLRSIK